jgi:hydrogenase/urease accessory protein HupE
MNRAFPIDVVQSRRWLAPLLVLFVSLFAPGTAKAHLVSSGVGPYYDGVAHFFLSPEDLVAVIALAFFGGLGGKVAAKRVVVALPVAWLAGAIIGNRVEFSGVPEWLPAVGIVLAGLLVAVNPKLPASAPAILAALLGGLHGFLNGRAIAETNTPFLAAAGIVSGLALVGLLLAAMTASIKVPWQKIAVRTLGSWAAAIGLLSIAWQFRPGA